MGVSALRPLTLSAVRVDGGFWAPRLERLRTLTLPGQHRLLEETGRIDNLRRASGRSEVEFRGFLFNDSDVFKWMEAVSLVLARTRDAELSALLDGVIDAVAAAQTPDGYLNSYFVREREAERYTDLERQHELYCAGHLIQAGVAHHRATGERTLLDVAVRLAGHICDSFGPGRRAGTGGHEEIELALVELYRETGERTYLDRARFFLDQRGATPPRIGGRAHHQDHLPVREQREAVGHAVRLTYLACGMADVAVEAGDDGLAAATRELWESAYGHKAYVTGGLGSRYDGEAFGADYELPNETAYAETCAAVGGAMWNWRLLSMTGDERFAGWLETTLYNGALAGISLTGDAYFYANPLAARPSVPPEGDAEPVDAEVQQTSGTHRRQPWFPCACCPPNVARLLASMPGYAYSASDDGLWVHLFVAGAVRTTLPDRSVLAVRVETRYPWEGAVRLTVEEAPGGPPALRLRIPGWAGGASARVNGQAVDAPVVAGTYLTIEREWATGDAVELDLPMRVRRLVSHPSVAANAGRVALARGPIVYCLEGVDNAGVELDAVAIPDGARFTAEHRPALLGGVTVLRGDALELTPGSGGRSLDEAVSEAARSAAGRRVSLTAIPYFAWANREPAAMQVWTRTSPAPASG